MNTMSTVEVQIAERARAYPDEPLTNLHDFIDQCLLSDCLKSLNKKGAAGVDGENWQGFNEHRNELISALLRGLRSGSYRAPKIVRTYIPKGDYKSRRLGLSTGVDKLLQSGVNRVLKPVYEQLFYRSSYGFRPGKSQHQVLEELFREVSFKG